MRQVSTRALKEEQTLEKWKDGFACRGAGLFSEQKLGGGEKKRERR